MDIQRIRQDFPMLNRTSETPSLAYFDNASTTFKPQVVIDAMNQYYTSFSVNPGRGEYNLAYQTEEKLEEVRSKVAAFIHTDSQNIVFTSGTTIGINMIAFGLGLNILQPNDEVIITESDHAANVLPWYEITKKTKAKLVIIPLDNQQRLTPELLKKYISTHTKIVAFAEVSNVLGTRNDVEALTLIAHQYGAIVVCDGAQAIAHRPVNVTQSDVDFYVFSGHKMIGPTGVGVLYGKKHLLEKMDPIMTGGGMSIQFDKSLKVTYASIPYKFEAGTLNISGVFGLGAAIDYLTNIGMETIHQYEETLKTYALEKLSKLENVIIYNPYSDAAIITFNIKDVFAQDAATYFNAQGIAVRSGQHCARNLVEVLKVDSTVRWSAYFYNTFEEIDRFIEAAKKGGQFLDAYF